MHKNYNEAIQIPLLNKIIEKSRRVQFHAEEHKYFLDTFELTSVTTQIDKYKSEFQSNKIATSLCKKHNEKYSLNGKYNQRKPEYYLEMWRAKRDLACSRGTMIHLYAESYPYFDEPKLKEHEYIHNFFNDLDEKYIFINSEIRIYSTSLKLAGTLDLLLYNTETKKYIICDYKSNEDIYKKENGYFNEPFADLKNTKLNSYLLQLNFYKYCFEEMFNANLIEDLWIIWLHHDNDNYHKIPTQIIDLTKYLNIK